ncbi:flagellar filament capping protein FliD [Alkalilimnicola ehrlichii MLHE-1]|uniref:Flagellar hook-associated protein 2 n=1 Tax=Alkalilimnicola ehrlichii (strain ATCC BAA-1101 / DSM 17681 / MLHE-1) TaxID=187272 RepID=Q0AAT0_ALKEH|nr:flagellar filament capping protein FliD [Alkalilimnicola ehrlichii]ABI56057.1 flagellar hook-associated 2 domain protein [Alkalilimnicola ehrlichii MLHE-1]
MASISSLGVGSGLDIRDLVDQLVAAERQPGQNRLDRQESRLEAQISGLGRLQQAITDFGGALGNVSAESDFRSVVATSNNESAVSVSAGRDAPPGSYDVNVTQLAQAQRLATNSDLFEDVEDFSAGTTSLGTGSFTIEYQDGSAETFQLEEGADTLQDVRAAINNQSENVRASVVDDGEGPRLVITSRETGDQNAVSAITVDPDDPDSDPLLERLAFDAENLAEPDEDGVRAGDNFSQLRAAQDAELFVDGLRITRPGNEISGVIDGVTLTLSAVDSARINVAEEPGSAASAVSDFVGAYNSLQRTLGELNAFDPESGEAGELKGDSTLRSVQARLRQMISEPLPGAGGPVQTLADLGITTRRDGTLEINDARLDDALSENRLDVIRLFTDEENGLAARLQGAVDEFTGRDSVINSRTESLQDRLAALAPQQERLDRRMDQLEARLIRQFSAMDSMIAQMNQTSEFLDNQLNLLNQQ